MLNITEENGFIRFPAGEDFDPKKIFECGQCFRWIEDGNGGYQGVAFGREATVRREGDDIFISATADEFDSIWRGYFDLDRDYGEIRRAVSIDDYMREASDYGAGIRILNQDRWETLCSFIISQCNNIPRIRKIIETMSDCFGERLPCGRSTFPDAARIAALDEESLAPLRCGYRAEYIITAARAVDSGALDLEELARGDIESAKRGLKSLRGIGEKVANCVILFSLRMPEAFPIDVWMRRAIDEHYGKGFDPAVFGQYAGIAQQYMFYYQRELTQSGKA